MQRVEIGHAVGPDPNDGIDDYAAIDPCGGLGDQRIAFGPIGSIDRVQPYPAISHMDLQTVAVML